MIIIIITIVKVIIVIIVNKIDKRIASYIKKSVHICKYIYIYIYNTYT